MMRNAVRFTLAVLVLFLAGCAAKQETDSTPAAAGEQSAPAGIRVINDAPAFQDLIVFLVPDNGVKELLGPVKAGETKLFLHALPSGNYTLEQQRPDGTSRSSRFYVAGTNQLVIWTISRNRVQVTKQ